ncbi:MAG: hypothetical protein WC506_01780 [Candidatus Micrarchaeia archaeon]
MPLDSLQNVDFEELSQTAKGLEKKAAESQRPKAQAKAAPAKEILDTDIEGISYADLISHFTKAEKSISSIYYGSQISPGMAEGDYRAEIAKKEASSMLLGKGAASGRQISTPPKEMPQEKPGSKKPEQKVSAKPSITLPITTMPPEAAKTQPEMPTVPVMPYISTSPTAPAGGKQAYAPEKKEEEKQPEKQSLADIARDIKSQLEAVSPQAVADAEKKPKEDASGKLKIAPIAPPGKGAEIEELRSDYTKKVEKARKENVERGEELEHRMDDLKRRMESETSKKKLADIQKQLDDISGQKKALSREYEAKLEAMRRESEQKEARILAQLEKVKSESQQAVMKARQEAIEQAQAEASSKAREEAQKIRQEYESRLSKSQEEARLKEQGIEKKMAALQARLEEEASRKAKAETQKQLEALAQQKKQLERENEALQSRLAEKAKTVEAAKAQSDEKLKSEITRLSDQMQSEMDILRDTYETKLKAARTEGIKHENFQSRLTQMNASMKSELEQARREYHESILKSPKDSRESSEQLLAKLRTISEKNRALRDELARQYEAESEREEQLAMEIQSSGSQQVYSGPMEQEEQAPVPKQMQATQEILPNTKKQGLLGGLLGGMFGGGRQKKEAAMPRQEVASPQEGFVKSPAEQRRLIVEINNMDDITITNYAKQNMAELYDNFNMGGITPGQFRFKVREHVAKQRGLPPGVIASGLVRDQNPFEQISGKGSSWGGRA